MLRLDGKQDHVACRHHLPIIRDGTDADLTLKRCARFRQWIGGNTQFTAATYNDPALTERLAGVFTKALGAENVVKLPPAMINPSFCAVRITLPPV